MVNAVQEVADAVGDVIRPVADVVGDVVRPVADAAADVLRPVGEAILENPDLKTAVNVAAVATGNSWAVPIINGADAVDKGADPGQVLTSIVVSTVAAPVLDVAGSAVAETLTDTIGSTMANFVTDTAVNVATNGGDFETAIIGAGLKSTDIINKTTNSIVDPLNIDTSTDLGKKLNTTLKTGVSTQLQGGDGVTAASVTLANNVVINPILERGGELSDEALKDVSNVLSETLVASAKGEDPMNALNNSLNKVATEDIRTLIGTSAKNYIDPVEELPMDTGEFLTEAVLPDKETLDKFRDQPTKVAKDPTELFTQISPASEPLKPTYTPPGVPTEEVTAPVLDPDVTPEAPADIPSAPKAPFPKIVERDLPDIRPVEEELGGVIDPAVFNQEQDIAEIVSPGSKSRKESRTDRKGEGTVSTAVKKIKDEVAQYKTDFSRGVDSTVDNYLTGLEALARSGVKLPGFDSAEEMLEFAIRQKEKVQFEGASATVEFINKEGEGYNWGKLDNAIIEQGANIAASLFSAMGLTAVTGNPLVGLAGPFAVESLQVIGPIAMAQARKNGRDKPNKQDWMCATGGALSSGELN